VALGIQARAGWRINTTLKTDAINTLFIAFSFTPLTRKDLQPR
jgi:hypothetical protein